MDKIKTLHLDLETFSGVNLSKSGVYRYAQAPDFEILLFGYSVNGGTVQVVDPACGEEVPEEILSALTDDTVTKWAFNASFERICLSEYLRRHHPEHFKSYGAAGDTVGDYLGPASWRCSMVWSAYMGLPLSLKGAGAVLGLPEQKLSEGKDLIRYFCQPCKPTKSNGGRTRNLPKDAPEKWEVFKAYNKRDVEVEMAVQERLKNFPVPDFVWDEYHLDQKINDRGIMVDFGLVAKAIHMDEVSKAGLTSTLTDLTGLDNPNSVQQLKEYLNQHGIDAPSLGKKEVGHLIKDSPPDISKVLTLRLQLAKSSVKKYQAMQASACRDNRCRGMFQFYGAGRTGRWAGRIVQLQNLVQNHLPDLAEARTLVRLGDYESIDMLYDSVPDVLSQLVRTAFVPRPGYKFIVADFSAIECRVIAWLAGEQWVLDTFAAGGDIYCATASRMFHCNVVKHGENGELRQKGKQATLSCSYGGSVGALKAMGALEAGMQEDELQPLVDAWREANPNIVQLWHDVGYAAMKAVRDRTTTKTHGLAFTCCQGMLFITLPSGRKLSYVQPKIQMNRYGSESLTYMGVGSTKKWERLETFSGKLAENIVQAIARDILAFAMRTLSHHFIVGHVHDEVIIEAGQDVSVQSICDEMGRTPPWAEGLVLRADGYECEFYQKS